MSLLASPLLAASDILNGANAAKGGLGSTSVNSLLGDVTNVLIFLIGAIAVIMIIIGGLRYVLSNGNAAQTQGAKNTILYAVVGLVLAISAFTIVKFALANFK